ncbi:MAG: aspartate/glutamate racemase family protein, partial [Bacteroidales bacterium]|nr:aspartate/glutamate racemase family protein [Bacteroidales bacterium]
MADNRPIGVFDSGLGGLSVLRALFHELPNESFIYYADSGNCPYGDKPLKRVQQLSIDITSLLISMECKMVVVACNSATAAAIDELRDRFTIPFVGIEPAVKQAALLTKSGKVGVLATEHTFNGRLFQET